MYADRVDLRIRVGRNTRDRGKWVKKPALVEVKEGDIPPIAISLSQLEAQALMDRLWKAGLRPTEGSGSAGALSATQHHLEDMRSLVFRREPQDLKNYVSPEVYRKIME
jgi:hypothetical protein